MTSVLSGPRPLPLAAVDLLERSRVSLLAACRTTDVYERYIEAHLGALRAAAALLAARSVPASRPSRPRSVWDVLPQLAPELREWAEFFAASAEQRAAIGRGAFLSARAADDLVRQSETFLEIVQGILGAPLSAPLPDLISPTMSVRTGRR